MAIGGLTCGISIGILEFPCETTPYHLGDEMGAAG